MGTVHVAGIRTYAYHGCMPEEASIGTWFETHVAIQADLTDAAENDNLSQTVDYVIVGQIVKEEMARRAYLIENVAQRIIDRCKTEWAFAKHVRVEVRKFNPPMNAEVGYVSVVLEG
jgi:dihydroneopterin aldolase